MNKTTDLLTEYMCHFCHAHTQTHRPVLIGTKLLINLSQLLNNVQID